MARMWVAFLLLAPAAFAQDLDKRRNWPVSFSSARYEIRATCAPEHARKLDLWAIMEDRR